MAKFQSVISQNPSIYQFIIIGRFRNTKQTPTIISRYHCGNFHRAHKAKGSGRILELIEQAIVANCSRSYSEQQIFNYWPICIVYRLNESLRANTHQQAATKICGDWPLRCLRIYKSRLKKTKTNILVRIIDNWECSLTYKHVCERH